MGGPLDGEACRDCGGVSGAQNGARGFLHSVALGRDPAQAKVLAYTAERIRARVPRCEFTAITEVEPVRDNPRHQFIVRLFEDQQIAVVPKSCASGCGEAPGPNPGRRERPRNFVRNRNDSFS